MDKVKFVTGLFEKMETTRPPIKGVDDLLTDEFMQKHTKFQNFKEMVQFAIKESGLMEEYLTKLKESIIAFDDQKS